MTKDERLLDSKEVAGILGTKVSTIHLWRHQGKGPSYIKVGRLCRYRLSDVSAFMEKNTHRNSDV
jgi:predicted DNA-binding transcriptional regulator AlpA